MAGIFGVAVTGSQVCLFDWCGHPDVALGKVVEFPNSTGIQRSLISTDLTHVDLKLNNRYIWILMFDVDLLGEGWGSAVDTGVVDTREHEHLFAGFLADVAYLADVHYVMLWCIWF